MIPASPRAMLRSIVAMPSAEYPPRAPASHSGFFEEFNVFGTETGAVVYVNEGESLPGAPRGFTWRPIRTLSLAELRERAAHYRQMAATARTEEAVEGLLKLAQRFETLAAQLAAGKTETG